MIRIFLIILTLTMMLISCGKNDFTSPYGNPELNTDNNVKQYTISIFPTDLNRYWIYESFSTDEQNNILNESLTYDSVVVSNQIKKLGKKCFVFITFNKNDNNYQKIREDYYFIENTQVWTPENWLDQFITDNLPINFLPLQDTNLIKILDIEDDLWRIYRIKLDQANIPNYPLVNVSGKADILCSWEGKTTVTTKIGKFEADEYLTTISMNLTLEIPFLGKQNIVIDREYTRFYVNKIGLIKAKLSSAKVSLPLIGDFILNGYEKTLINFSK